MKIVNFLLLIVLTKSEQNIDNDTRYDISDSPPKALMNQLNPRVVNISIHSVLLIWNEVSKYTSVKYQVTLNLMDENTDSLVEFKTFLTDINHVFVDDLPNGKTFAFTVTANYDLGESEYSFVSDEILFTLLTTKLTGIIVQEPEGAIELGGKVYLKCICTNTNITADDLNYTWINMNTGESYQNINALDLKLIENPIGNFACMISKSDDVSIIIVHKIFVKSVPKSLIHLSDPFKTDASIALSCEIGGLPSKIKWHRLEQYIEQIDKNTRYIPDNSLNTKIGKYFIENFYDESKMINVSILTIYKTHKYDTGVYVCEATNDLGSDYSYYELNGNTLLESYNNLFEGLSAIVTRRSSMLNIEIINNILVLTWSISLDVKDSCDHVHIVVYKITDDSFKVTIKNFKRTLNSAIAYFHISSDEYALYYATITTVGSRGKSSMLMSNFESNGYKTNFKLINSANMTVITPLFFIGICLLIVLSINTFNQPEKKLKQKTMI